MPYWISVGSAHRLGINLVFADNHAKQLRYDQTYSAGTGPECTGSGSIQWSMFDKRRNP